MMLANLHRLKLVAPSPGKNMLMKMHVLNHRPSIKWNVLIEKSIIQLRHYSSAEGPCMHKKPVYPVNHRDKDMLVLLT